MRSDLASPCDASPLLNICAASASTSPCPCPCPCAGRLIMLALPLPGYGRSAADLASISERRRTRASCSASVSIAVSRRLSSGGRDWDWDWDWRDPEPNTNPSAASSSSSSPAYVVPALPAPACNAPLPGFLSARSTAMSSDPESESPPAALPKSEPNVAAKIRWRRASAALTGPPASTLFRMSSICAARPGPTPRREAALDSAPDPNVPAHGSLEAPRPPSPGIPSAEPEPAVPSPLAALVVRVWGEFELSTANSNASRAAISSSVSPVGGGLSARFGGDALPPVGYRPPLSRSPLPLAIE